MKTATLTFNAFGEDTDDPVEVARRFVLSATLLALSGVPLYVEVGRGMEVVTLSDQDIKRIIASRPDIVSDVYITSHSKATTGSSQT